MRVLLVDDNPEFLKAAERILSLVPHLEVVGRASSGEEAVEQTKALRPGLVLINWSLPGMNGLEATRRISAQPNPPKVLILSLQDYPEYRLAAKEAGAEGLLSMSEFGQKIPSLIDYLTAQEDLEKPHQTHIPGRPGGEDFISPFDKSPVGGFLSGEPQPARPSKESSEPPRTKTRPPLFEPSESASGMANRPPADHRMPELLEKLRENLTALETHCFYLQHWLEGGGKDSVPGQRDPALNSRKSLGPFREAVTYYLLFEIHKELYALPADQVLSVENPAPLIQLPREFQPLVGLSDINQRRVPIIDLRLWEKLEKAPLGEAGRLILVESKGVSAGLLVDAVRDLTTSAAPEGYPLPSDPAVGRKPFRDRLIQVKDRFLYVWDVDKIIAFLK
jgi:CheY-like chemotaxis protein